MPKRQSRALKDLTENHGVILHDTPADYFPQFMAAAGKRDKNKQENKFFLDLGIRARFWNCRAFLPQRIWTTPERAKHMPDITAKFEESLGAVMYRRHGNV